LVSDCAFLCFLWFFPRWVSEVWIPASLDPLFTWAILCCLL
jgi:hypothetical protein